jgi:hypothetical protein
MELSEISGGDWSFTVDLKVVQFTISGQETVQDMAGGAYNSARDAMANFFTWLDPAGYYDSTCSSGGR